MTFTEITQEIKDRLNLTSAEATTRIGREVNARYRRVTSAIGLDVSRRVLDVTGLGAMGQSTFTFTGLAKIERVFDTRGGTIALLNEITFDEMRGTALRSDDAATLYAIQSIHPNAITVMVNAVIKTIWELKADGLQTAATLSGTMVPGFSEDYHDILVEGVVADELRKMEKLSDAKTADQLFEYRLSELRIFIAKSAYLTRRQGGRAGGKSGAGGSRAAEGGGGGVPGDQDIHQTGLVTFDRDPNAPFAVSPGSAPVANLIAEGAIYVTNVETDHLIGRDSPGTGNSEHVSVGGGLEFTGTVGLQRSALTGAITAPAGSNVTTLAANSINGGNIIDGSVGTTELADGSVTTQKLADGSVTSAKIADATITAADLAPNSVTSVQLADDAVTTSKIKDFNVINGSIADGAINTRTLTDLNVTTVKIADLNVTTPKLADGAVTTPKLADGAVTGPKIAAGTITLDKLPSMNASRLLGRGFGGLGPPEEIVLGTNLTMSGTTLNAAGGSGGGGTDTVTNVASDRLIGRDTAGIGNSEQIAVGGGLRFTDALSIEVANNGVTFAKMQDMSAPNRLIGRGAGSSGDPEEILLGASLSMSGTTLNVASAMPLGHHLSHEPGGADALVNVAWTNLVNEFTGLYQLLKVINPQLIFWDTPQPVNTRTWRVMVAGQTLSVGLLDDAFATELGRPLQLTRTGDLSVSGSVYAPGGLGATPLNATNLTTGSIPDARLSANVALKNINNAFSVPQSLMDGTVIVGASGLLNFQATAGAADTHLWRALAYGEGIFRLEALNDIQTVVQGTFLFARNSVFTAAGGLGSTPLNATQLTSGTVPDARLSGNVAFRTVTGTFVPQTVFSPLIIQTSGAGDNAARLKFFDNVSSSPGSTRWQIYAYQNNLSIVATDDADVGVVNTHTMGRDGVIYTKGINLPAGNPSTGTTILDHYEEGNWTPGVNGTNGGVNPTYTWARGTYVKVGRLVTVIFDVQLASAGAMTGELLINGLPFRAEAGTPPSTPGALGIHSAAVELNHPMGQINPDAFNIQVFVWGPGAIGLTPLLPAWILNSTRFVGTFSYRSQS